MDSSSLSPLKYVSSLRSTRPSFYRELQPDTIAKVKVIDNVSAEEMLGTEYVSPDGDPSL